MASGPDMREFSELAYYATQVSKRSKFLLENAVKKDQDIAKMTDRIESRRRIYRRELNEMQKELAKSKEEVRNIQKSIVLMIATLKNSSKSDDFKRLEKRVDAWNLESFVTRTETRKVLFENRF